MSKTKEYYKNIADEIFTINKKLYGHSLGGETMTFKYLISPLYMAKLQIPIFEAITNNILS